VFSDVFVDILKFVGQTQPLPCARRKTNFEETLKVSQDATLDDIKAAFKRQALLVHPDKGGSKDPQLLG